MGNHGTLCVSEATDRVTVYREPTSPTWKKWADLCYLASPKEAKETSADAPLEIEETGGPARYNLTVRSDDPPHKPHLENFFQAVRGGVALNCPATTAYKATAVVLRLLEAAAGPGRVEFDPSDFQTG